MSRRNGRLLAQRLASEKKLPPLGQQEKIFRKQMEPLVAGFQPGLQERLLAAAVAAAVEWSKTHR
ncbi:MAG: hypothetical protein Q7J69_05995 [Candidatus Omnitrophota bacterium]|nr:hypothetical protein [Candidatus Omnitrophota bacterium]